MCGICGLVTEPKGEGVETAVLWDMVAELRHRGPDDEGVWVDPTGRTGLGHSRLSILDLSPAGHQPMADPSGRLHIVFNGEIYNFRELRAELKRSGHSFRSETDTEVILAAYRQWGAECLSRFNGMFAFVLHDLDRKRILLARDRAGEKPLFYMHSDRGLIFASELKAIFAGPSFRRRLDLKALDLYLAFGYVPGARCMVQGVKKLPAGHAMIYDLVDGSLRMWQYWDLPRWAGTRSNAEELVDELEALLEDSVRLRMRADVPVGILLSGGIDSSLITAIATRVTPHPVRTFTVSFPGQGNFDEARHARTVAEHFGTDHEELVLEPATVEILPKLVRQYDEPLADSSMVPTYLLSRVIRRHAKVALGGDGGDELFGGYKRYPWIQRLWQIQRRMPQTLRHVLSSWSGALPSGTPGRHYLIGLAGGLPATIAHANMLFDRGARERLLAPVWNRITEESQLAEAFKISLCDGGSALQEATRLDFRTYLTDDILVKVDRASMLASLEVRSPWLDHRIVEFAFGRTPDELRATATGRKVLPRLLADRLLPHSLETDRKQGFSIPLDSWYEGEWGGFMRDVLAEASAALFDQRAIDELFQAQSRGYGNMHRLFALTMFELWRRHFGIEVEPITALHARR